MWDAVHKKTETVYLSSRIWDKFEKPHDEEWYCCKLHKYPVTPVKAHKRKINGEEISVLSHFRNITENICNGESVEHWQTKVDIVLGLKEKRYLLLFRGNIIEYDFESICNEVSIDKRRADILIKFNEYNSFLGYGIVIEVLHSEKEENFNLKAKDWIKNKYSITSIKTDCNKEKIHIDYPYSLYEPFVKWCDSLTWNRRKFYQGKINNKKWRDTLLNDRRSWNDIPDYEKDGVLIW